VGDSAQIRLVAGGGHGRTLVHDAKGQPMILFDNEWTMRNTMTREKELQFHDVAP
jgi:peptide subunit release factor RF-3